MTRHQDEVDAQAAAAPRPRPRLATLFKWVVVLPTLFGLAFQISQHYKSVFRMELLIWIIVSATIELIPLPGWRGLQLSLSFPILLGVSMLYAPIPAAAVGLVGSFDVRELRGTLSLLSSLFNRCQMALAALVASGVFHGIAHGGIGAPWYTLVPAGLVAAIADYSLNVSLVTIYMSLHAGFSVPKVLAQLRLGALHEFLLGYLGLGLAGIVVARLYEAVGFWAVAAFILPLVFARQLFFRMKALQEASTELRDRERVMRALSNRMAEERQDERMQIAGYLHDDLAQQLFRLTLQVEMAKKRLAIGDSNGVNAHLDTILEAKSETAEMVRALIKDLHRSPIGRDGLGEAIFSYSMDMTRDSDVRVHNEVVDVSLPPPIQLLIYHIAREAIMNSMKHAEPSNIWISLQETDDGVELQIRDDGTGFDTTAPGPEGHFGSVMMRERALVAGGTLVVDSEPGRGTTISARFPRVWVEEGTELDAQRAQAPPVVTRPGAEDDLEPAAGAAAAEGSPPQSDGRQAGVGETRTDDESPPRRPAISA
jgi:signal transduction histidine kinase